MLAKEVSMGDWCKLRGLLSSYLYMTEGKMNFTMQ